MSPATMHAARWRPWPGEDMLFSRLRQAVRAALTQDAAAAWAELTAMAAWDLAVPLKAGGLDLGHVAVSMLCEEAGAALAPLPVVDTALTALLASYRPVPALSGRIRAGEAVVIPGRLPSPLGTIDTFLSAHTTQAGQRLNGMVGPCCAGIDPAVVLLAAETEAGLDLWWTSPAATAVRVEPLVGQREDGVVRVCVDGADVDRRNVVLPGAGGAQHLAAAVLAAAVYQASLLAGLTAAAVSAVVARVRQRRQFGKLLSEHQAPRLSTAALLARLDVLRLAVADAAAALDAGEFTAGRAAGVVALAAETALDASRTAVHLHGAFGLSADSVAGRCYRRIAWEALRCGTPAQLWRITSG